MSKIRILIADDHTIVRIGLKALVESEADIEVVGEAEDGKDAVKKTLELRPDVVIMDLVMPKLDGADATHEICAKLPDTKVLILTTFGTSDGIAHALEAGAHGALMKTTDDATIVAAIRDVARGRRFISQEVRRQLALDPPTEQFSPRQSEIMRSITKGLSNKEIASNLGIRIDSVEEHVKAILKKLGAANRAEAVAIALRKHLLKI